jgi:ankyrin repeat protein
LVFFDGVDANNLQHFFRGHAKAIRTLCELGADVNTISKEGSTPVWAAAYKGHVEAIRGLGMLGADVNTPSKEGVSPVFAAAANGHEKAVKLLRKLGADLNAKPSAALGTPLVQALLKGYVAVAEKLIKYTSQCACCQKQASVTVKLLACSRCKKTYYCSAVCQKQDWKQHK